MSLSSAHLCALSSDPCWKTTGIPTVDEKKRDNKKVDYYIKLLKYTKTSKKRGTIKTSPKFETKHDATANLFHCRYKEETPASRKMVDEHLVCPINKTSPAEKGIPVSTAVVVSTAKRTAKKAQFSWSIAMSGAPQQNIDALQSLNPKLASPFNRYNIVKKHDSNCHYFLVLAKFFSNGRQQRIDVPRRAWQKW